MPNQIEDDREFLIGLTSQEPASKQCTDFMNNPKLPWKPEEPPLQNDPLLTSNLPTAEPVVNNGTNMGEIEVMEESLLAFFGALLLRDQDIMIQRLQRLTTARKMSVAEDDIAPSTTGGATPTTQASVPITTGPLTTTDSGAILRLTAVPLFYTPSGPQHHDRLLCQQSEMFQQLYQQPLRWGHFNPDSTEEMYVLTRGPQRDSQFELGLCENYGYPQYGMPGEVADQRCVTEGTRERSDCWFLQKDYDADACIKALEQGQREMKRDLDEVILTPTW
ncbi:UNVERIFIED_CONTAM: hypothetical protein K2H54_062866 [Gekko kuhli]